MEWLASGDLVGHGSPDVAAVAAAGGLWIYSGFSDGVGQPLLVGPHEIQEAAAYPSSVATVADVDGDEHADLVTGGAQGLAVYLANP
jgi:hypothetical protein